MAIESKPSLSHVMMAVAGATMRFWEAVDLGDISQQFWKVSRPLKQQKHRQGAAVMRDTRAVGMIEHGR